MDLSKLSDPLPIDQIDFRIQSINKGGYATILAYKDARVDRNRLDDVVGPLNWQRRHTRDNHNCIVGIWDEAKKQWVEKEDVGTESNTEKEKGLASDSFKRACFMWGIGVELYDYPEISVKLKDGEEWEIKKWFNPVKKKEEEKAVATWKLKLKEWKWFSHFEGEKLSYLGAKDQNGQLRFEWGVRPQKEKK